MYAAKQKQKCDKTVEKDFQYQGQILTPDRKDKDKTCHIDGYLRCVHSLHKLTCFTCDTRKASDTVAYVVIR